MPFLTEGAFIFSTLSSSLRYVRQG